MSDFLNILRARIDGCGIGDLKQYVPIGLFDEVNVNIDKILERIDSLGENARRMLEIGVVQDELVKLGFELFNHNGYGADIDKMRLFGTARFEIVFHPTSVFLYHIPSLNEKQVKDTKLDISYNSTTWQEDLINRVKELIK